MGGESMNNPLEGAKYVQIEASEVLRQPGFRPTREQFLADPSRLAFSEGPQPEWVVEAFRSNDLFRENILYALSRSVSKYGDFHLASGWMELLATAFSPDEVRSLYAAIRDQAGRGEAEWRAEFEAAFPGSAGYLPELPREERVWLFYDPLFNAIATDNLGRVREVVAEMGRFGIRPDEVRGKVVILPEGVSPEQLDELPVDEFTFDLNAVEYAERIGAAEVLAVLRGV
jgi:hypothetical protein